MRVLVYGMVGKNKGGIERYLLKMNSFMENTIFDYVIEDILCVHQTEINQKGGNIYYINSRSKKPIKNIRDNFKLLKTMRLKTDTVYFNVSSLSWIIPILIAKKYKYKIYIHSHNAEFIKANSGLIYRIVNKIGKLVISKMRITRLTCSKPATEFIFGKRSDVTMIYNAINVNDFRFCEDKRNQVRDELKITDSFVIGFVGRIAYQKNPLFLAEFMKEIVLKYKNVKMIIIGDGDMKDELKDKITAYSLSNNVLFLGNVLNVNDFMQAMDLFVLPSFHEGLPYVVVEAQCAGLHCILSKNITVESNITGNASFIEINNIKGWVDEFDFLYNLSTKINRYSCADIVSKSTFDITSEAKRLEKILTYKIV